MTVESFSQIISRWCEFWERKHPSPQTLSRWYPKARSIPESAVDWIASAGEDRYEKKPENLLAAMWGLYKAWQELHPELIPMDFDEGRTCKVKQCDQGLLHVFKADSSGIEYEYVFRCSDCYRSKLNGIPEASWMKLLAGGYNEDRGTDNRQWGRGYMAVTRRINRGHHDDARA